LCCLVVVVVVIVVIVAVATVVAVVVVVVVIVIYYNCDYYDFDDYQHDSKAEKYCIFITKSSRLIP
jgi:hypothetical protein